MAKDAYDWYEEQRNGLGEEFLEELEIGYAKILKNPTHYPFIAKGFRRFALGRFPYVAIYEVISNELIVFAVFHTSRNPDKRLKD